MRWLAVAIAGLVLVVAVVGTTRGVEGERYIAANEELFAGLPTYPGSRLRSISSTPYRENESPWSRVLGYGALVVVELPRGADPDDVAAFYERGLSGQWTMTRKLTEPPFAAGPILQFERGEARVGINLESWRGRVLEVYVDDQGAGS